MSAPKIDSPDDDLPVRQFLTYRLNRVHARLNAQATRLLAQYADVSLTEWRAIALMGDLGETTLTSLSREGHLDKGLLSRTIKALIARGLVIARQDENDNRIQRLTLSPEGRKVFVRTLPRMQARQRFLRAALTAGERAALIKAMEKLEIAADQTEFPE